MPLNIVTATIPDITDRRRFIDGFHEIINETSLASATMSYRPDPSFPLPEKDAYGGDNLPTYDELAAQHGPNSRYAQSSMDGLLMVTAFVLQDSADGENGLRKGELYEVDRL